MKMISRLTSIFVPVDTAIFLLVAMIGDLLLPFVLALFCKEYSHTKMVMSLLGNKKYPIHMVYSIWLILAGCLLLISSVKLYGLYFPISKILAICMSLAISAFAIGGCILSGLFSVAETKDLTTIPEKIHGYGSVIGFILMLFAPLFLSLILFKAQDTKTAMIALLSFLFALVAFVLFVMADKPQFLGTIVDNEGLWQRLTLLFMYFPFITLSLKQLN